MIRGDVKMQERSKIMDERTADFILAGLTDRQKGFYLHAIKEIEQKGIYTYVIIFPDAHKQGWSRIQDGMPISGGSRGAPLPLGYPIIGPYYRGSKK